MHPSPLPIAAAHYPASLKKLRRPILQSKSKEKHELSTIQMHTHAEIVLAAHLERGKCVYQTMAEVLSGCRKRGADMRSMIESSDFHQLDYETPFWTTGSSTEFLCKPVPSKELLYSVGLSSEFDLLNPATETDDILESKVEGIRTTVLPPHPLTPDPSVPRLLAKGAVSISQTQNCAHRVTKFQAVIEPPRTPALSPAKSTRSVSRKSVRFSTARRRTGRPSMFQASGGIEDEVDRVRPLVYSPE